MTTSFFQRQFGDDSHFSYIFFFEEKVAMQKPSMQTSPLVKQSRITKTHWSLRLSSH